MTELRDYQIKLAQHMTERLKSYRIAYLAAQVRTGKTLTALTAANMLGMKRVLFLTKKKAMPSIIEDYKKFNFAFALSVHNYEQAHKLAPVYDLIIVDEAHSLGAYPKPSLRTKIIKNLVQNNYLILLSGTPNPESFSQLYHQFWISDYSPFKENTFYKWAKIYVNIKRRMINGLPLNDYSQANTEKIWQVLKPVIITFTQSEAGFAEEVNEQIIFVSCDDKISRLIDILNERRYYQFRDGAEIVCDTAAKHMIKIHQIQSGTIKTEDGQPRVLSTAKANYIKKNYQDRKIAIYYKFIAEGEAIRKAIPNTTESTEEFNASTDKVYVSQIQSGAMGLNLSTADVIIFYNIDFSSVLYWQARARMQSRERTKPAVVHWLMTPGGIEEKIYKAVLKKKNYTTRYFRRDYAL